MAWGTYLNILFAYIEVGYLIPVIVSVHDLQLMHDFTNLDCILVWYISLCEVSVDQLIATWWNSELAELELYSNCLIRIILCKKLFCHAQFTGWMKCYSCIKWLYCMWTILSSVVEKSGNWIWNFNWIKIWIWRVRYYRKQIFKYFYKVLVVNSVH